jgi:hypothetical protein
MQKGGSRRDRAKNRRVGAVGGMRLIVDGTKPFGEDVR